MERSPHRKRLRRKKSQSRKKNQSKKKMLWITETKEMAVMNTDKRFSKKILE